MEKMINASSVGQRKLAPGDFGDIEVMLVTDKGNFTVPLSALNTGPMDDQEIIDKILFPIHTHADLCDPEEIVYKEKDVIELIKRLIDHGNK